MYPSKWSLECIWPNAIDLHNNPNIQRNKVIQRLQCLSARISINRLSTVFFHTCVRMNEWLCVSVSVCIFSYNVRLVDFRLCLSFFCVSNIRSYWMALRWEDVYTKYRCCEHNRIGRRKFETKWRKWLNTIICLSILLFRLFTVQRARIHFLW